MRGTQDRHDQHLRRAGIIPADAGNTGSDGVLAFSHRDHPRGCGEHYKEQWCTATEGGSSPRMRGTPSSRKPLLPADRIIPADAGNTMIPAAAAAQAKDHPRGCGEHEAQLSVVMPMRGSSPRMRGTLEQIPVFVFVMGIIPADAGNTSRWPGLSPPTRDHPRGCGEHQTGCSQTSSHSGSSPRMRGTLLPVLPLVCVPVDHPRGCGEHAGIDLPIDYKWGSSPRMRGTPSFAL